MKINSRQKGARGERELAHFLTNRHYPARRGQQFSGSPDSPDVVCKPLDFMHIECKFVEALNVYKALEQAATDAGETQTPVCMHRRKNTPWHVTMTLDHLLDMLEAERDMGDLKVYLCPKCGSKDTKDLMDIVPPGAPLVINRSCRRCSWYFKVKG